MNNGQMVLSKMFSGRFVCIVLFAGTACYLAIVENSIRDAFMALAAGIIRDYYSRSDRAGEPKMDAKINEVKPGVANGTN